MGNRKTRRHCLLTMGSGLSVTLTGCSSLEQNLNDDTKSKQSTSKETNENKRNQPPSINWHWGLGNGEESLILIHEGGEPASPEEFDIMIESTEGSTALIELSDEFKQEITAGDEIWLNFDSSRDYNLSNLSIFDSDSNIDSISKISLIWENPVRSESQKIIVYEP